MTLHESVLNEIKGTPIYPKIEDTSNGSNSDVTMVGGPNQLYFPDRVMPTDPRELYNELCKQIMSIQDPKS